MLWLTAGVDCPVVIYRYAHSTQMVGRKSKNNNLPSDLLMVHMWAIWDYGVSTLLCNPLRTAEAGLGCRLLVALSDCGNASIWCKHLMHDGPW